MRTSLAVQLAWSCACLCAASLAAEAKTTHHHTWNITYQYKSLDRVRKLAVTINGESPGPTIHATQADTLIVTVHNMLETENTAIHWHGIRQVIHMHCLALAVAVIEQCNVALRPPCVVGTDWQPVG
ncbi:hypothetical protein E2562_028513 [Oryza meyeriana var. granulata]|uniref:Plastocyanin-like domain-containing protein n=1 Tax=Oryza meyeriana var. granulata TaxID=110450 RepID=A0A6G1DPP7_9ORYZ|nr:hypothetical protein E2562_028513 [Oryza meyeriana var. granulata]